MHNTSPNNRSRVPAGGEIINEMLSRFGRGQPVQVDASELPALRAVRARLSALPADEKPATITDAAEVYRCAFSTAADCGLRDLTWRAGLEILDRFIASAATAPALTPPTTLPGHASARSVALNAWQKYLDLQKTDPAAAAKHWAANRSQIIAQAKAANRGN